MFGSALLVLSHKSAGGQAVFHSLITSQFTFNSIIDFLISSLQFVLLLFSTPFLYGYFPL